MVLSILAVNQVHSVAPVGRICAVLWNRTTDLSFMKRDLYH
ncbi:hypothetical protein L917_02766 [Phytophthora nicotianae]|uniref:Uncharacterized protein n=1 Tax=Phytophthora nicotianae TaxID=4792 RepID=W2LSQ4_PHYNI|nr:hypothetical protein L917_02766 [Phytophthora nicotianae]ETM53723.1 hypothetical protein L914_02826 [Phytophthora nicotianae]